MSFNIGIIGGTDSSGGSGLAADEETILHYECNAVPVISAITFQTPTAMPRIFPIPGNGFSSQLDSLLTQPLDAIKIGMLPDTQCIEDLGRFLDQVKCDKIILDPVKNTSTGHALISEKGWAALIKDLLPKISLITPNFEEALSLLGLIRTHDIIPVTLAKECLKLGSQAVLLKGGHISDPKMSTDFLITQSPKAEAFSYPRINGGSDVRGTGCRLATAIACEWAKSRDLINAVQNAGKYLQGYIQSSLTSTA